MLPVQLDPVRSKSIFSVYSPFDFVKKCASLILKIITAENETNVRCL